MAIQGFAMDDTLENIRADLRKTFVQRRGFPKPAGPSLSEQGRPRHDHAFHCRPDSDWKLFAAMLKANRPDALQVK